MLFFFIQFFIRFRLSLRSFSRNLILLLGRVNQCSARFGLRFSGFGLHRSGASLTLSSRHQVSVLIDQLLLLTKSIAHHSKLTRSKDNIRKSAAKISNSKTLRLARDQLVETTNLELHSSDAETLLAQSLNKG
jgi:hypothetical protein